MELLERVDFIVGFMLMLFGAGASLLYWFDKRSKSTADAAVRVASGKSDRLAQQVKEVEDDLGAVAKDVISVKRDLTALNNRVHGVERSMETVVRVSDFAKLNAEFQHHAGSVNAEVRAIKGMLDSIHRAALRASDHGDKS